MPYLSSNITSSIFYGSISSEFVRIGLCTLIITDFVPKTFQLYNRMVIQDGNKTSIQRQIKKAFRETFSKYCNTYDEVINEIIMC